MLTDSNPQKIVIYVKTSKGQFGPYPSRSLAEHYITTGMIPKNDGEQPEIMERLEDGRSMLFG